LATPHRSAALAARFNSSITPSMAQFLASCLLCVVPRRYASVRRHRRAVCGMRARGLRFGAIDNIPAPAILTHSL